MPESDDVDIRLTALGASRGPPHVYCPNCEEFKRARSLPLSRSLDGGKRRLHYVAEPDIAWFRRRRRCTSCGAEFLTGELSESLIEELLRLRQKDTRARATALQKASHGVRTSRKWLDTTGDDVPVGLARELVAEAAWWLTHSSGPVRARRHADRLEKLYCGWSVEFGANWFAAARALARARNYANTVFALAQQGKLPSKQTIRRNIRAIPNACVLNVNLDFYDYYRSNGSDELVFGAQAIDINDCEKVLMRVTGLDDLITEYTRVRTEK